MSKIPNADSISGNGKKKGPNPIMASGQQLIPNKPAAHQANRTSRRLPPNKIHPRT